MDGQEPALVAGDEDRDLVRSIARGSADALGALYDRYASTVFALARRILSRPEDAEEVVQDVFAQVWRQASRYRSDRATVAGWVVMLARTRAIDRVRARLARPDQSATTSDLPALLPAGVPSPEMAATSSDEARAVRRALASLRDEQRTLVEMAYYDGLTQSEIADQTGIPIGTVKTRIRAAMSVLREAIGARARTS